MSTLLEKADSILLPQTQNTCLEKGRLPSHCTADENKGSKEKFSSSNGPNNSVLPSHTTQKPVVAQYNDSLILTRSVKEIYIHAKAHFLPLDGHNGGNITSSDLVQITTMRKCCEMNQPKVYSASCVSTWFIVGELVPVNPCTFLQT